MHICEDHFGDGEYYPYYQYFLRKILLGNDARWVNKLLIGPGGERLRRNFS